MFPAMKNPAPARIVAIDDHAEHLDYLVTLLRRAGYVVEGFAHAVTALDYIARTPVSLVITDVFMPEMDGFEVLKALLQSHPELPLIAVSGTASPEHGRLLSGMKTLGARAVFTKPLDAAALLESVSVLIRAG
jgi:two-component system chemotaxis response regulator CheY